MLELIIIKRFCLLEIQSLDGSNYLLRKIYFHMEGTSSWASYCNQFGESEVNLDSFFMFLL